MPASHKSPPLSELTGRQIQWILGGAAMTLATMPGQTNFIAQFNTSLRDTFGLSHGAFGGLYTLATLASAFTLVWAGALADRIGWSYAAPGPDAPAMPTVTVDANGVTVLDVFRSIGTQAGDRATLLVDPDRRMVQVQRHV